ncbi:hypothetical protein [Streptomyces sp. URMC 129]|uniref:hypothetical protein n=1 Tax=Streptomyces sp. URMC 129 TaxID=3423407 RepID=UPI003F1AE453
MTEHPPGAAGRGGASGEEPGRFRGARAPAAAPDAAAARPGTRRFTARLFTAAPAELSAARHFTALTLRRWELAAVSDDARSVVSELMAWAMADTAPESIWLGLAHHNALLCVLVPRTTGHSPAGPWRGPAPAARHRRHIIDTLTREWGRTEAAEGAALWARIPTHPRQP